jgi:hypothetical protein
MRSDEDLIADHNIRIIAQTLIDVIEVFSKIQGCENAYIRDLGRDLANKHNEDLKEIVNSGNGI